MQLQTTSTTLGWVPMPGPMVPTVSPAPHSAREIGHPMWSNLSEIVDLLHFEGRLRSEAHERLFSRRRLHAGETVVHMGQPFDGMYVVRLGALKTNIIHSNGSEHVLTFPMKGDLMGYDGSFKNQYLSQVVALTDCEVIKIPVQDFSTPVQGCHDIERLAYWAISREVAREQNCYALLHSARTDARVARFLTMQSRRFADMGYSPTRFVLPMTRRDIGNYLDVTLETVSRAFSTMHQLGLISVNRREVHIHSLDTLCAYSDQV